MGLPGALGVVPEGGDAPSIGLGDVAHLALEEHGRDSGSSAHTVLAPIPSEVPAPAAIAIAAAMEDRVVEVRAAEEQRAS